MTISPISKTARDAILKEIEENPEDYSSLDPDVALLYATKKLLVKEKVEEIAIFDLNNSGDQVAIALATAN